MKREVITHNSVEGFHRWPDAPEVVSFLRSRHRHIFEIRCWWEVTHNEREVEIILQQREVERYLASFGSPAEFNVMSCESIAQGILARFDSCVKCQVLEDGYGGAELTK